MKCKHVRQGVPVREVRAKMVRSNRFGFVAFLMPMFGSQLGLFIGNCIRRQTIYLDSYAFFLSPILLWLAWLFAWKIWNYNFVAEDGYYINRWGYAVHIPWEMIASVDDGLYFLRVYFRKGLTDEATGTPFAIRGKGECRMWRDRKAIECFRRHVLMADAK